MLLFLVALFTLLNNIHSQVGAIAKKGILDARNWSWENNGLIDLNGQWEFYWNALYSPADFAAAATKPPDYIKVPGDWNNRVPEHTVFTPAFGYATYHLRVLCPPFSPPLALKFLNVNSSYALFVNGKLLNAVGKVGNNKATTQPDFKPAIVPVTPVNNQLDIVIEVANYTYNVGGLMDKIELGPHAQVNRYYTKIIAQDFFIAGSFFCIGIFYFIIYFFFRRRKSPLYFALSCILIGVRPLITGELGIHYFTHWSWQFIKHTEYLSVYLTVPALSLFSHELFPAELSKKALRIILIVTVPFFIEALIATPFVLRYTLIIFQVILLFISCYGLYVYICAVKNRRAGSIYLLAGFIFLFITIINDVLYSNYLINTTNLLYLGLYIFIISQAITLSRQFLRAFVKIEKLNTQLEQINDELQLKNNTINESNEQLSMLNAELDNLVFRTSHDLRSPITSMYVMTDLIRTEENAQVRNEYIDFQKKTISRLDSLISDILHFAKNKNTKLHYEPINMQEFIEEILQDQIFSYGSENVKRIVEIQQPCAFETDKLRLSMVINNLISNGLKHHNKAQENPYLRIVVHATEKEAMIEVSDNGKGIPQSQLNSIFNLYYQINTTAGSSGFGLYIVKDAVNKLGGTIKVESQLGAGTSFFIVIPNGAKKE